MQLIEECEAASKVGNREAMYAGLRKLGRRGYRGLGGTTLTSERFKAHFEKLTVEIFENTRELIERAVNEETDAKNR